MSRLGAKAPTFLSLTAASPTDSSVARCSRLEELGVSASSLSIDSSSWQG